MQAVVTKLDRWGDICGGHDARDMRTNQGPDITPALSSYHAYNFKWLQDYGTRRLLVFTAGLSCVRREMRDISFKNEYVANLMFIEVSNAKYLSLKRSHAEAPHFPVHIITKKYRSTEYADTSI
jgi:hypothetical protein